MYDRSSVGCSVPTDSDPDMDEALRRVREGGGSGGGNGRQFVVHPAPVSKGLDDNSDDACPLCGYWTCRCADNVFGVYADTVLGELEHGASLAEWAARRDALADMFAADVLTVDDLLSITFGVVDTVGALMGSTAA